MTIRALFRRLGAGALVLAAAVAAPLPAAAERVLTLVGDPWPPFVEGELGRDAVGGRAVELARMLFERVGDTAARFPLIPWNRALRGVETGKYDGIMMLLKTAERERYLTYSERLFASHNLVWYSAERMPRGFEWSDVDDLRGRVVGVTRGYSYGEEVDAAIAADRLQVIEVPTVEHLFAMLARGRLELALANDSVGFALARQSPQALIVPAAKPTGTDVYYMALSRQSPSAHLMPAINDALAELRREGLIQRVMSPR